MVLLSRISSKRIALDIGGTLIKIASSERNFQLWENLDLLEKKSIKIKGKGKINLGYSDSIHTILNTLEKIKVNQNLYVTGGGAYKYDTELKNSLFINNSSTSIVKIDEIQSLIEGSLILLCHTNSHFYSFSKSNGRISSTTKDRNIFPKLIVNIGSGISYVHIESGGEKPVYERVTGTMISGGTLLGLSNLLYGKMNYEEMMWSMEKGNLSNVDVLVKDIYGEHSGFQIDGEIVAGSLCKVPQILK